MKSSGIGGQAVLEGVMMKNKEHYAVAVRKPDNQIEVKKDEFHSMADRVGLFKLPLFRGMAVFAESLILGARTLTYSSNCGGEEPEGGSAKETMTDIGVILLSLFMAVAVFILFPLLLSNLLGRLVQSGTLELILEGVLRIVMFVVYLALISRLEDIKRVFMYHGAEHKCINCAEGGEELTVANVRRQSRCHKCCNTGFLLLVMLVSFVFFMFIRVDAAWLRYLLRILLIPVIAGITYELISIAGSGGKLMEILQKLTTREPDDSMIEVAIASVEAVFDWQGYQEEQGIAKRRKKIKKPVDVPEEKVDVDIPMPETAAAMGEKDGEDEDDQLSSLDHYFVFDGPKAGMGGTRNRQERGTAVRPVGRPLQTGSRSPGKIPILIGGRASSKTGMGAAQTGERAPAKVAVKAVGSAPATATKAAGKSPVRMNGGVAQTGEKISGRTVQGNSGSIVRPATRVSGKSVQKNMVQPSTKQNGKTLQEYEDEYRG
ncbi:MAG: DUF1385 domain-containing protein [Lachnospiraceae bacterium]|nr:DUF1385 domain-containing protein [Lachnospiraceae bacterium]